MTWIILGTVATIISTIAYIITALYIRAELKGLEKDRYLDGYEPAFHDVAEYGIYAGATMAAAQIAGNHLGHFTAAHRADMGELAFHRVGSFYDRVGTLIKMELVNEQEILATMGGYAIAVWQKIGPLVQEARQIENSVLFQNYERMLPACHECYVPALKMNADAKRERKRPVNMFMAKPPVRIGLSELRRKLERREPVTLLDVRQAKQVAPENRRCPTPSRFRRTKLKPVTRNCPATEKLSCIALDRTRPQAPVWRFSCNPMATPPAP